MSASITVIEITTDLNTIQTLNPTFSQLLTQLLYSQPELRPAVLKALGTMATSNSHIASDLEQSHDPANPNRVSRTQAASNVVYLRGQAESWLAVLFNVFGSVSRDGRGLVGDVIAAWAKIAEGQVRRPYLITLCTQFDGLLPLRRSRKHTKRSSIC